MLNEALGLRNLNIEFLFFKSLKKKFPASEKPGPKKWSLLRDETRPRVKIITIIENKLGDFNKMSTKLLVNTVTAKGKKSLVT